MDINLKNVGAIKVMNYFTSLRRKWNQPFNDKRREIKKEVIDKPKEIDEVESE